MLRFPNELAEIRRLKSGIGCQVQMASEVTDFWLHLPFGKLLEECRQTTTTVVVAMALNTQATRQFRTAVELCERAEGADKATGLKSYVQEHARDATALLPSASRKGAVRNEDWKLDINAEVEPEQ